MFAFVICIALSWAKLEGQTPCPTGVASDKLVCLIPQVYGVNGLEAKNPDPNATAGNFAFKFLTGSLSSLESAIARQAALLPLASPSSGVTFTWDASSKVFVASTGSYGPILSDRAETIGKYKVFLGFDYQYFKFSSLDGQSLKTLPVVLPQDDFPLNDGSGTICSINGTTPAQNTGNCGFIRDVIITQNRVDLKIHQFTTFITFGLTNRIELSAAIPIENVRTSMVSTVTIEHNDSPTRFVHAFAVRPDCPAVCLTNTFSNTGSASGIGDITVRVKATAWKGERAGLALGSDVRLPTGDSLNYLGVGAPGAKPFVIWSYTSRIEPHAFVGYEMNGSSVVAGDILAGKKDKVPGQLTYSAGADMLVKKNISVAVDLVGQQIFQARRTIPTTFTEPGACNNLSCSSTAFPRMDANLSQTVGTFNITSISLGAKAKPVASLLITGNALVKLNQGGLRSTVIPLLGVSYTF
jgi:hypothetical protein